MEELLEKIAADNGNDCRIMDFTASSLSGMVSAVNTYLDTHGDVRFIDGDYTVDSNNNLYIYVMKYRTVTA